MRRMLTRAGWVAASLGILMMAVPHADDNTHGRDATPDYARVFSQDTVKRLDIRVTAADWARLATDMTEMAGPQGAAGGGRGGGGFGGFNVVPDPAATAACNGGVEGSACSFGAPPQGGRCTLLPMGAGLSCTRFRAAAAAFPVVAAAFRVATCLRGRAETRQSEGTWAGAATWAATMSSSCPTHRSTFRPR